MGYHMFRRAVEFVVFCGGKVRQIEKEVEIGPPLILFGPNGSTPKYYKKSPHLVNKASSKYWTLKDFIHI